ncbi:hypothetical protein C2845_PM14G07060 [Panicum miliaceum]|uniref:Uncharacterized protein n=1 Tax=Panicum miliaceum TaxID=4540 RepID=A0A3L6PRT5_PANMI|nr:hypothetical protein C2845_PM14G07060 [Panicum miliaceum]
MAHRGPVVFLFVGMTCRIFEDKLTLQGSTLCKWYANPELPETAALQDRYRLSIIATDPVPPTEQQSERTIQLMFFGSIAQEIIGTPVDTLIAANEGLGIFLPTKITALYGKYRSTSPIKLMLLYMLLTALHLHHLCCTSVCHDTTLALPGIGTSGVENPDHQVLAGTKAPESSETNLPSTPASLADLKKTQVPTQRAKGTNVQLTMHLIATKKMIQGILTTQQVH